MLSHFQCQAVILIWISAGQWPTVFSVNAGEDCLENFSLS